MNFKKKVLALVLTFIVALTATVGVSAATQGFSYASITVPKLKSATIAPAPAERNYKYVLNAIFNYSGPAAVHSKYYSYYNGTKQNQLGNDLKTTSTGAAFWNASNDSSVPVGWSIAMMGKCSGTDTSSSYCALKGSTYALYLDNQNVLSSFTVSGQFTFTDGA